MAFVKITDKEFFQWADATFGPEKWELCRARQGREAVIRIPSQINPTIEVHLYTSFAIDEGVTRDMGTDAIRVVMYDTKSQKPVFSTKKVLRTEGKTTIWDRIKERILECREEMRKLHFCKKCGSHLVERTNRATQEKFWGCSAYPHCPVTKGLQDRYPLVAAQLEESGNQEIEIPEAVLRQNTSTNKSPIITDLVEDDELANTKDYPFATFPFPKFNRVQSTIIKNDFWKQDVNLVLGTTTSSGKTVAAELFMAYELSKGKKVVYVSPLKSLTQEKYTEWGERYSQYHITILTGDYVLSAARAEELREADIICLTSEMIDSRTRNHKSERSDWLWDVGLIIVDETHIISTGRGHAVEVGLMRFAKLVPSARILCLSATLPNVDDFRMWLTELNGKKTEVINSSWRPTQLEWHYMQHITQVPYHEAQAHKRELALRAVTAKPNEKFLVFVHDKNTGRMLESEFKNAEINTMFHNADLELDQRLEIEKAFEDRENGIRVLISTSTLAWGRSLPARNVIIVGVTRGIYEVDELDIIQMAGRAGRSFPPKYRIVLKGKKDTDNYPTASLSIIKEDENDDKVDVKLK